ncbi:hypothetical protein T12_68 [Trichinella patagoniensis]|uniref:Uncharacterized protein n=1 Tax=Trichinella patagoniensis TaxID=990121 RepID=A0A0V0YWD8_9BILA|nr:hypothetical protein T12_68 [Trichinella patagoniensis]
MYVIQLKLLYPMSNSVSKLLHPNVTMTRFYSS